MKAGSLLLPAKAGSHKCGTILPRCAEKYPWLPPSGGSLKRARPAPAHDVVATLGPRFGWWYCERDRTPIVRLGELQALRDDRGKG